MKILVDVLKDSQAHYLDVQSQIQKRLRAIPSGSIQKRRFKRGGDYYYLKSRKGYRFVSKYLGKNDPVDLKKAIEERRLLLKRLKDVRQSLAILNRLRWKRRHAR